MLSYFEEALLLMLDDEEGTFLPVRESTFDCIMSSAVLMDLAFLNRIDSDPSQIVVLDRQATGNAVLDTVLDIIASAPETRDTKSWIEHISASHAHYIREQGLSRLVELGILESHEEKFMWVFRSRRYPVIDGKIDREVKLRIIDVLMKDDIPDPRDAALICLVDAAGLLSHILSKRQVDRIAPRLEQIRKIDLIGRGLNDTVTEIEQSIMMAIAQASH